MGHCLVSIQKIATRKRVGAEGFDRRSRRADAFRRRAMPEQLIFFIGSTPSELVRMALQRSGGGRAKPQALFCFLSEGSARNSAPIGNKKTGGLKSRPLCHSYITHFAIAPLCFVLYTKKTDDLVGSSVNLVGAEGFEPPTLCL